MTDEPPDESEARARLFEELAAQIRLNKDAKFGGAFLIVPPSDAEPFSSLMLNQDQPGVFWGAMKALVEMALQEIDRGQRQQGFGR